MSSSRLWHIVVLVTTVGVSSSSNYLARASDADVLNATSTIICEKSGSDECVPRLVVAGCVKTLASTSIVLTPRMHMEPFKLSYIISKVRVV